MFHVELQATRELIVCDYAGHLHLPAQRVVQRDQDMQLTTILLMRDPNVCRPLDHRQYLSLR